MKHPHFQPLFNEAKLLYAFILRWAELSRKNGWADEYGRIYLYYPICEVVDLLHCGWQKAVNTLRELQYAKLIDIKKQGCGKTNCIYPKSAGGGFDDYHRSRHKRSPQHYMENLTGGTPPVRPLPCVVSCKLYFPNH